MDAERTNVTMRLSPFKLVAAVAMATILFAPYAWAATEPIAATAALVEGEVVVIPVDEEDAMIVEEGDGFAEGDRVITGDGAALEIRFENGDHMRLDERTDMTIKSLHKKEKDTFSIFGLNVGAVRFYVAKLFSSESKFEYHTRAAIAGVGGSMGIIKAIRKAARKTGKAVKKGVKKTVRTTKKATQKAVKATKKAIKKTGKVIKRSGKKIRSATNKGGKKLLSAFAKLQIQDPNNNTSVQSQIFLLSNELKQKAQDTGKQIKGHTELQIKKTGRLAKGKIGKMNQQSREQFEKMSQIMQKTLEQQQKIIQSITDGKNQATESALKTMQKSFKSSMKLMDNAENQKMMKRNPEFARRMEKLLKDFRKKMEKHEKALAKAKAKEPSKKSWMYVIARDKKKTRVEFKEGHKTFVPFGKPPLPVSRITRQERARLLRQLPFKKLIELKLEKKEPGTKKEQDTKKKKKDAKKKTLDILTRRISTPINKPNPLDKKLQQLDRQYQQGGGVNDKKGTGSDATPNPAPQRPKVKIKINIPSHGSSSGAANRN